MKLLAHIPAPRIRKSFVSYEHKTVRAPIPRTPELIAKLRDLCAQPLTQKQIARALGFKHESSINQLRRRYGIDRVALRADVCQSKNPGWRGAGAKRAKIHPPPVPGETTRKITLTRGKVAVVDVEDFERLSLFSWIAHRSRRSDTYYARRRSTADGWAYMHQEVMRATGKLIDHRNGDGLLNTKGNLRFATPTQNACNRLSPNQKRGGFRGVTWYSKLSSWHAKIKTREPQTGVVRNIHIGYFYDASEAARAYDAAAVELFGEFARLNFPKAETAE